MAGAVRQHRAHQGAIRSERAPRRRAATRVLTALLMSSQEDMLWISDPKALQYVFQTSGYNYPKQPERRVLSRLIGDTGLTWAEGMCARTIDGPEDEFI